MHFLIFISFIIFLIVKIHLIPRQKSMQKGKRCSAGEEELGELGGRGQVPPGLLRGLLSSHGGHSKVKYRLQHHKGYSSMASGHQIILVATSQPLLLVLFSLATAAGGFCHWPSSLFHLPSLSWSSHQVTWLWIPSICWQLQISTYGQDLSLPLKL